MRAAEIVEPGKIAIREVPDPLPSATQVRIAIEGCGICASSLPLWEGRPWFTYPQVPGSPGHEGWGIVDAVGDQVDNIRVGQRVSFLSDRAFAELDVAEAAQAVMIPDELGALPFPGEALGCALNIFHRAALRPGEVVAIIGVGFLGAALTELAVTAGATVLAVSNRSSSRELATARGARITVPFNELEQARASALELSNGALCSCVIEAVGNQQALDVATALIGTRGRLIIAGYHQDGERRVNLQEWNWKGIDVINAHERDPQRYVAGIQHAVEAVLEKRLNPLPLLTHEVGLAELSEGFELLRCRPDGFVKGVMRI